jgi:hypothetical protein
MHDSFASSGNTADWTTFFNSLSYSNNVTRPDIVGDPESLDPPTNQTLGISLYVTSDFSGTTGQNPEPTALMIWAMLAMIAACISGRNR